MEIGKKNLVYIIIAVPLLFLFLTVAQLTDKAYEIAKEPMFHVGFLSFSDVLGVLISVVVGFFIFRSSSLLSYLHGVVIELEKVVYPTPSDSVRSAGLVVFILFIATAVLVFFDGVWEFVVLQIVEVQKVL